MICHLHVGMPKTGTTAIQEAFARLGSGPVRTCPVGPPNKSGVFTVMFENRPWAKKSQRIHDRSREETLALRRRHLSRLSDWLARMSANPAVEGVFFSGERLGTALPKGEIAIGRLHDRFAAHCRGFRVYGYVRPLASHLPSTFQQRLKTGAPATLDLEPLYPDYRLAFEKFDRVFGRENVSLRRFDKRDLMDHDVVADLAAQIGIALPVDGRETLNRSLGLDGVAVLFALRRAGYLARRTEAEAETGAQVFRLLARLGGGPFGFEPDRVGALLARHEDDLGWIEARIGARVSAEPASSVRVIRHDRDLLDIAAEARPALAALEPGSDGVDPNTVLGWLEHGLAAA